MLKKQRTSQPWCVEEHLRTLLKNKQTSNSGEWRLKCCHAGSLPLGWDAEPGLRWQQLKISQSGEGRRQGWATRNHYQGSPSRFQHRQRRAGGLGLLQPCPWAVHRELDSRSGPGRSVHHELVPWTCVDLVLLCTQLAAGSGSRKGPTGVVAGRSDAARSAGRRKTQPRDSSPASWFCWSQSSPCLELRTQPSSQLRFNQNDHPNPITWFGALWGLSGLFTRRMALGCFDHKHKTKTNYGDSPDGPVAKTPHSQLRGSGFDSWSGTQESNQIQEPGALGSIPGQGTRNQTLHVTTKSLQATTKTWSSETNR